MFAERLRLLRKKAHLTQYDMANHFNIAKSTYSSYEQGKRMPDTETQIKIADFFLVSLDYLHGHNMQCTADQFKSDFDLKYILNDPCLKLSYGGRPLTYDENEKIHLALKLIFWNHSKESG